MSRRLVVAAAAAFIAVAIVLAGCGSAAPKQSSTMSAASAEPQSTVPLDGVPAALRPFYTQSVTWKPCDSGEQCATIKVPMNYADPSGKTITLALAKLPATSQKGTLGSLLVNPGGPGESGISFLSSVPKMFSAKLRAAYDIIGFDPRGVGKSSPVTCATATQIDTLRAQYWPPTDAGIAGQTAAVKAFGQACATKTGPELGYIDTASAARDMDVIRSILGNKKMNYLGYSYGTALGTTYAELFPTRVGHLVLDGAMDPSLTQQQLDVQQAASFELNLRAYAQSCLKQTTCPLTGTVDQALGQIHSFLQKLATAPLPTTDPKRPLTVSLAIMGIVTPLYDNTYWPYLTIALTQAMKQGQGTALLLFADAQDDRQENGTYATNTFEANMAITCLDYPVDSSRAAMDAEAKQLIQASPTFGEFMGYSEVTCANWPVKPVSAPAPASVPAGTPTIVVVGTTGDPATPYAWAQALARQLGPSGDLLTYKGYGHTAYGRSNSCITNAVDTYLVNGTPPKPGTTC